MSLCGLGAVASSTGLLCTRPLGLALGTKGEGHCSLSPGGRSGSGSWVLGAGTELEGWQNVPRAHQVAKVKVLQCVLCSVSTVLVRTQYTSSMSYKMQIV